MAFNEQENKIIQWAVKNGKTREETEQALFRFRTTGSPVDPSKPIEAPQPEGFISRAGDVIQEAGRGVQEAIAGEGEFAGQTPVRRGVEATAEAFNAVPGVAIQALPEQARGFLGTVGEKIGGLFSKLTDKVASTKLFSEIGQLESQGYITPETAPELYSVKEALGTAQAGGEIAGDILLAEGLRAGAAKTAEISGKAVSRAGQELQTITQNARPSTAGLLNKTKEVIKPSPNAYDAVGQVLQGKTKDLKPALQAFRNIELDGVSTYSQLLNKMDDAIGRLSTQVDDVLARDTSVTKLSQLTTKSTVAGKTISRNYVQTALNHLKELYAKTADDAALANIDDIITRAKTTGLTKVEINDISRIYGAEFGSKAFSKVTGDPLTSVNAQMFENIRKGLKFKAREGMGTEAAQTDKIISSIYNTKKLVGKNVEAVNKLQQRITERGLFEKIGHAVSTYGDILTGGSIRGFISGVLPRGAGYKVLNALDLEERLRRNLEIINKALQSGTDEAIIEAGKALEISVLSVK